MFNRVQKFVARSVFFLEHISFDPSNDSEDRPPDELVAALVIVVHERGKSVCGIIEDRHWNKPQKVPGSRGRNTLFIRIEMFFYSTACSLSLLPLE